MLGYMVGASNSPVVASVVPAAFSFFLVALGVTKIELPKDRDSKTPEPEKHVPILAIGVRAVGIMLTVFAFAYLGAVILGSRVRISGWGNEQVSLPWTEVNQPKQTKTALEWLVLQKRLMAYGYSPDQIRQVYALSQKISAEQKDSGFFPLSLLDSVPEPGTTLKEQRVGSVAKDDSHIPDKPL